MSEIKNILYENGVEEVFRLVVPEGDFAGTYTIGKPDGWDDIDSVVNVNEDYFNVEDFIIGESEKIIFYEYDQMETFNLIKNIYKRYRGDGQIIFKWLAIKDNVEIDLLGENFEINLNKYSESFEKSKRKLELEIKKREAQSKFLNREDTTVNLFDVKNIDQNDIEPVETFTVGFKKGDRSLSNFYTYDISQFSAQLTYGKYHFPSFLRSDDYEFGDNKNEYAGFIDYGFGSLRNLGPFVYTDIQLKNIKVEISNLFIGIAFPDDIPKPSKLIVVVDEGATRVREVFVKGNEVPSSGDTMSLIKIENQIVDLGTIEPRHSISIAAVAEDGSEYRLIILNTNTTIEIKTSLSSPLVRTEAIRVKEALNQLAKNYTDDFISVESTILSIGGFYYNTSVSTGVYLRGLPSIYTIGQKIKTSFKSLFYDGVAPLLALGFDINTNKLIIEDVGYFFKNIQSYDLTGKIFSEENYKLENDKGVNFNQLLFGTKKYSTQEKGDIKDYNTKLEATTPTTTVKDKFDKQTDLIISEPKIQELIEDSSSSTNDSDDDMVLIDMVNVSDSWDDAVFENCQHQIFEGKLKLICQTTPFDTTFIEVGNLITIVEGYNVGTWTVLEAQLNYIIVDKTTLVQEGNRDTPIRYKISALVKNRTGIDGEGFTNVSKVKDIHTSANLRHNPKFQMARWFPYFGSGLVNKGGDKEIVINNYKNNDEVELQANSSELSNELQGLTRLGSNVALSSLREQYETFFNGENIEITLVDVMFHEFLDLYKCWKFGKGNDRSKSRGFITLNTPEGILNIYPFGKGALSHNKSENELSIKGKVKGLYVENPVLSSVEQLNSDTVRLKWDYSNKYDDPIIQIQYSLDSLNWTTIETVENMKEADISNDVFKELMTGDIVYFRIRVDTDDFHNKNSNVIYKTWQFNDYVIKETYTNYTSCGDINSSIEIRGVVDFTIDWTLNSFPGGGSLFVTDNSDNSPITSINSSYGDETSDTVTSSHSVNGTLSLNINVKLTNKTSTEVNLSCSSGSIIYNVGAILSILFKNTSDEEINLIEQVSNFDKKYFDRPVPEA